MVMFILIVRMINDSMFVYLVIPTVCVWPLIVIYFVFSIQPFLSYLRIPLSTSPSLKCNLVDRDGERKTGVTGRGGGR